MTTNDLPFPLSDYRSIGCGLLGKIVSNKTRRRFLKIIAEKIAIRNLYDYFLYFWLLHVYFTFTKVLSGIDGLKEI